MWYFRNDRQFSGILKNSFQACIVRQIQNMKAFGIDKWMCIAMLSSRGRWGWGVCTVWREENCSHSNITCGTTIISKGEGNRKAACKLTHASCRLCLLIAMEYSGQTNIFKYFLSYSINIWYISSVFPFWIFKKSGEVLPPLAADQGQRIPQTSNRIHYWQVAAYLRDLIAVKPVSQLSGHMKRILLHIFNHYLMNGIWVAFNTIRWLISITLFERLQVMDLSCLRIL